MGVKSYVCSLCHRNGLYEYKIRFLYCGHVVCDECYDKIKGNYNEDDNTYDCNCPVCEIMDLLQNFNDVLLKCMKKFDLI